MVWSGVERKGIHQHRGPCQEKPARAMGYSEFRCCLGHLWCPLLGSQLGNAQERDLSRGRGGPLCGRNFESGCHSQVTLWRKFWRQEELKKERAARYREGKGPKDLERVSRAGCTAASRAPGNWKGIRESLDDEMSGSQGKGGMT